MLEGSVRLKLDELMQYRRSIRKYQDRQILRSDLEKIVEAGLYAPNAGSGQRSFICAIHNKTLCEKIGRLNAACFDRNKLIGQHVSDDQPSIIDDASLKSGFYGAPTVCVIFGPHDFLYSIPDAFCCAENMVLMATELGLASCIVARSEETFDNQAGIAFLKGCAIPANYIARCFVLLGYCDGDYPPIKKRKGNRMIMIE